MAIGWSDGAAGLNQEHALVQLSANGGQSWTNPAQVEQSGDRPDFAFIGLSPNGRDLYVVYDGFSDPFRNEMTSTRQFVGVTRHADVSGTTVSGLATLDRGVVGDSRGSSANALFNGFLGDYNTVAATNAGAVSVFNDARECGRLSGNRHIPPGDRRRHRRCSAGAADGLPGDVRQHGHILGGGQRPDAVEVSSTHIGSAHPGSDPGWAPSCRRRSR